jgi:hypothetical protein
MTNSKMIILLLLAVITVGCNVRVYKTSLPLPTANYYYRNPEKDLHKIGRVAIVELENDSTYPQISADLTKTLFQELQKRQVFGLSIVRRNDNDPAWRSLQLSTHDSPYTLEQLASIRKVLRCDAVLIGTITEYRPYPHMTVGLSLKAVDLTDGQLLWALEQVWDGTDKTIEQRMKIYFRGQKRSAYAPLREQLISVSPIEFLKFVCYEVGATL